MIDQGTNIFHPLTSTLDKYLQTHSTGYHPFALIPADWKPSPTEDGDIKMNDHDLLQKNLTEQDEDEEDEDVEELDESPTTPPPGFADPSSYTDEQMDGLLVLMKGGPGKRMRVVPLGVSTPSLNTYFLETRWR